MSKEGAVAAGAGAKGVVPVVHSAYILEHFGTFWNILGHSGTFWNNLELSRTFLNVLDVLEGCRKVDYQVDHRRT